MQTDKKLLPLDDGEVDHDVWNKYIKETKSLVSERELAFFTGAWLLCECYMYRRIYQAFVTRYIVCPRSVYSG